ncbi:MAG: glycosyltransferase family 2 protein [Syntrophobacterales bacterium]|nr:glycosyltransferase family 2 protein [Syntrophobacterales bacterium]
MNRTGSVDSGKILSIVIITKDTKDLLKDLLTSIGQDASTQFSLLEIIVVDNGSTDGTDVMVREEFSGILLVKNGANLGFAASANAGFRQSSGEFVLFLNSDTILIEGELSKMLRYMVHNRDVGICGPQLVYEDMRLQRSSAPIPSLMPEIVPRALLERVFPRKYSGKAVYPRQNSLSPVDENRAKYEGYDVESLIGAAVMARREAVERVKGFDERFFFFLEESDLCARIRTEGLRVVLFPGAKVIHLQGKTVRKSWVNGRIEYNISMYKFIRKHYSSIYYRCFQLVRFVKATVFLAVLTCLPILLIGKRTRRTYTYYARLVMWHFSGCPDDAGLHPTVKVQSRAH